MLRWLGKLFVISALGALLVGCGSDYSDDYSDSENSGVAAAPQEPTWEDIDARINRERAEEVRKFEIPFEERQAAWDKARPWNGLTLSLDAEVSTLEGTVDMSQSLQSGGAVLWDGSGKPDLRLTRVGKSLVLRNHLGQAIFAGESFEEAWDALLALSHSSQERWTEVNHIRTDEFVSEFTPDEYAAYIRTGNYPEADWSVVSELVAIDTVTAQVNGIAKRVVATLPKGATGSLKEYRQAAIDGVLVRELDHGRRVTWNRARPWQRQEYLRFRKKLPGGTYIMGLRALDQSGKPAEYRLTDYSPSYQEETDWMGAFNDLPFDALIKAVHDAVRKELGYLPDCFKPEDE